MPCKKPCGKTLVYHQKNQLIISTDIIFKLTIAFDLVKIVKIDV